MIKPCTCPLCREPMRNLPHGTRTWHCSSCGETMTEGYLQLWQSRERSTWIAGNVDVLAMAIRVEESYP